MGQHLSSNDKLCCPQCGHKFLASEQKIEQQAPKQAPVDVAFDRAAAFARIRNDITYGLKAAGKPCFSNIKVTTNDDSNVGTPIAVTVHFRDGKTRTARAGVLQPNIDQFVKSAVGDIVRWADLVYGGSVSAE